MKNPYETTEVQELQEIAFYWMQRAHRLSSWKDALLALMEEKGFNPSIYEIIEKVNQISEKEF